MAPGQIKESMDSASIRSVMVNILGCGTLMNFVTGQLAGPIVASIIILIVVMTAVFAVEFSVKFRRNKPGVIKGFATLSLSWFALTSAVFLVLWSLYQLFTNPTLSVVITLISGIVICSAPVSVLWSSVISWVSRKAEAANTAHLERKEPHQ
ncbi:hypothetical protein ACIPVK_12160 [Paeniglutamicibacter sp. MACA_103]|uniref:hypothetical protein n=1 Tax=Paeniglutamicibacter sp. MACA_103 TaxID=3377337 RepID=UPI0038932DA2